MTEKCDHLHVMRKRAAGNARRDEAAKVTSPFESHLTIYGLHPNGPYYYRGAGRRGRMWCYVTRGGQGFTIDEGEAEMIFGLFG